jgi:hypothetical protein
MASDSTIRMLAMEQVRKQNEAERKALLEARLAAEKDANSLEMAARETRLKVEQEREMARIRAERALAEAEAHEKMEAVQRAVLLEVERIKNRTPIEILQDEIAELRYLVTGDTYRKVEQLATRVASLETELSELTTNHQAIVMKFTERISVCELPKPGNWVFVGNEHQKLNVPENSLLRWGAGFKWYEKRVSGSFVATNDFFGYDPLFGTVKIVEMWVQ